MLLVAWSLLELTRFAFDYARDLLSVSKTHSSRAVVRFPFCAQHPCAVAAMSTATSLSRSSSSDLAFEALDLIFTHVASTGKIAHSEKVTQPIEPGTFITVSGYAKPECLRFAVDFVCDQRSMVDGTIAFHFNPRLQEGYVVRNCLLRGAWGDEETTSVAPMVLTASKPFHLTFLVTSEEFMVAIDGQHFCSFRHRVAMERITSVDIVGDVDISYVVFKTVDAYPFTGFSAPPVYDIPFHAQYQDNDDLNLPVPFIGRFKHQLKLGYQIEICGKVKLLPHSFYINLQCGLNFVPHPVVPLHLNPRFSASCGSNAFVRNCWTHGKWQKEERAPGFPFSPGYSFTLVIQLTEACYCIWVNKKLIAEYPYMTEKKEIIDAMYIQGDIFLHHVQVHKLRDNAVYKFEDECFSLKL